MCSFCDDLKWREYNVELRNSNACDNLCEVMTAKLENINGGVFSHGVDCEGCGGCVVDGFILRTYDNRIGFSYNHKIKELFIGRNSEMIDINFCPWCGKQLTDSLIDFTLKLEG